MRCPFCGSTDVYVTIDPYTYYCGNCEESFDVSERSTWFVRRIYRAMRWRDKFHI